jgi:hypothetical protein
MKTLKISAIILLSTLIVSCGKTNKTNNSDRKPVNKEITETTKSEKPNYSIKSGIVEYTTKMMNMDVSQTLYFDDYGAKKSTVMVMDIMGQNVTTITITKDGYVYTFNPDKKTGTKTAVKRNQDANIDFKNLSKEMEKKMNLKNLGRENFIGKVCDKYSIDYTDMQMKGTFLVWEGIALKTDVKVSSTTMLIIAKKIQENAAIPADKFEVPSNIKFQ